MYSGGSGTQLNPYLIANLQDFNDINNNMSSYFKQIADISLGTFQPIGYNGGNATPIDFTGYYDGNNYKLQDAYINYVSLDSCGIFRHANGGTMTNIILDNIQVNGNYHTGSLVGQMTNSTVSYIMLYNTRITGYSRIGTLVGYATTNSNILSICTKADCTASYNTYTDSYIGGIVGYISDNTTVENCANNTSINGYNYTGGIAGYSHLSTVKNCLNIKSVKGVYRYTGGIVGYVSTSTSVITKCLNRGDINGYYYVGGIIGSVKNSTTVVSKCFALCNNITSTDYSYRITGESNVYLTDNYALSTMVPKTSGRTADGLSGADITIANATKKINYTLIGWSFIDTSGYWDIDEDIDYPTLSIMPDNFDILYSGGSGTATDPYLISNVTDLKNIECKMFSYFKQTADITLGNFEPIGYNNGSVKPINFAGYYDGNNYSLQDGIINYPSLDYVGIFRAAINSTNSWIKNIKIDNVQVTGKQYVGTLVGDSYGATVTNVHIDSASSVLGLSDYVGGIAGTNSCANSSNAYGFVGCSNNANVIGANFVGGIVGFLQYQDIINCLNTGTILANSISTGHVGGIAGRISFIGSSFSEVFNCINSGDISGCNYIGGIVGSLHATSGNRIKSCYALNNSLTRISGSLSTAFGRISGNIGTSSSANYALDVMQFIAL